LYQRASFLSFEILFESQKTDFNEKDFVFDCHVPTTNEWHLLILYLDANASPSGLESLVAGDKLKETGTTHWISPNTGASNQIGFTAVPGGTCHQQSGSFYAIHLQIGLWSSTVNNTSEAWMSMLMHDQSYSDRFSVDKKLGNSVRCIRNF
jgi:uncharacterized protein (TIGR02145 family)